MVDGATFGKYDIPFCPTAATHIPKYLITWEEAKQIPDYEKNTDVALLIADDIKIAMKNAEKLRNHFLDIGAEWPSNACNPRTDVPIIIDVINRYRNRQGGGVI